MRNIPCPRTCAQNSCGPPNSAEMDVDNHPSRDRREAQPTTIKISKPPLVVVPPEEPTNAELAFPAELLPRSQGIDMVVGREQWHRQVPSEWVPIITRDIQSQQQLATQAPFSDAYLSTQPAKKRRLAEARKPEGTIEKVISDTLKDAIKVSGVQPKPSTSPQVAPGGSTVALEVSKDEGVQTAVKNDTRGAIKRRLQHDPDFKPKNFPNSQDFVAKK